MQATKRSRCTSVAASWITLRVQTTTIAKPTSSFRRRATFGAKLYLNQATVEKLANSSELRIEGDASACDKVLDLFDKLDAAKNEVIPKSEHRAH